jgi:hypothetical protein
MLVFSGNLLKTSVFRSSLIKDKIGKLGSSLKRLLQNSSFTTTPTEKLQVLEMNRLKRRV